MFFYGFMTIGIFSGFSENPQDFWRIPGIRDFFWVLGFSHPRFSPNHWDLRQLPGIYAKSPGLLSPGFGIFYPRDRDFFVRWDIPTKIQLYPNVHFWRIPGLCLKLVILYLRPHKTKTIEFMITQFCGTWLTGRLKNWLKFQNEIFACTCSIMLFDKILDRRGKILCSSW